VIGFLMTQPTTGLAFAPDRHLLLGVVHGRGWFVDRLDDSVGLDLRRALPLLDPIETEIAVMAAALTAWHRDEGFCPGCGRASQITAAGTARQCDHCRRELYPRTDPAVIVAVTDDQERLLLVHQAVWPPGRFSVLAGFVEAGESAEQAVHREAAEETGLKLNDLAYVASQPWPLPRSLMLAFSAHASATDLEVDGHEITQADWFSRHQLRAAVAAADIVLPGSASIAYRLISSWLDGHPA